MKRTLSLSLPALLLALLLLFGAGCSAASGNKAYAPADREYSESPPSSNPGAGSYPEKDSDPDGAEKTSYEQKKILRASVTAESLKFDEAVDRFGETVTVFEGYIGSSEISGNSLGSSARRRAYFTVRVPAASFRQFLDALPDFLNVTSERTSSEDVTQSYYETQSRLNSLKIQEERLLTLLEQAEDLSSILEIETKLSDVRWQIEYYDSMMRSLDNKVDYATVDVTLYEVVELTEEVDNDTFLARIGNAFRGSWSAFLSFLQGLVIVLIYLLPILILAALIVLIVLLATRKSRKEHRARKLAARQYYQNQTAAPQTSQYVPAEPSAPRQTQTEDPS